MELLKNITSIHFKKLEADGAFRCAVLFLAFSVVILVFLICTFLFVESWSAILSVFTNIFEYWSPMSMEFNLYPMILGSFAVMLGAVLISMPLSVLSALYVNFYAGNKVKYVFCRILDVLAGIPSVIYGVWGLMVIVPVISQVSVPGTSLLAGVLVLSLMIMPIGGVLINRIVEDIDSQHRKTAFALGISKFGYIWNLILPLSYPQMINVLLLKSGRAIGETMIVVMVCGNIVQVPESIYDSIRTLTANVALELGYAEGLHRSYLFLCGFILVLTIYIFICLIEKLTKNDRTLI